MNRYRYYLDGNLLADDPVGWNRLKQKIHFVPELNARLLKVEVELTFHGDGFDYILTQFNTVGHCGIVDIEIHELENNHQTYRMIHKGYIFLSSIQIDRKELTIRCPVEDNSFYARINNNKNIETFIWAERSKNDIQIAETVASPITFINHQDCTTTYSLVLTFGFYRVYDLFRYLVDFMGDANIDFASDLFDVGGDYEGLIVTCGYAVRLASGGLQEDPFKENFQKLSFLKLFTEVNKKIHVGMTIETVNGRPVLRIERDSYFHQDNVIHSCDDIDRVVESINNDKLYTKIKLGSTTIETALSLSFPENITYLGFKEEEFLFSGECNIADRELNLVSNFIISSNVIEDCLLNGAASYDKDFIFVMTEPLYSNYVTKTGNILGDATPCQYNLDLTNKATVENWIDSIPNSIVQYLGDITDGRFRASNTVLLTGSATVGNPVILEGYPFDDDSTPPNFDFLNTYNPVIYRFTALADGVFSFHSRLAGTLRSIPTMSSCTLSARFKRYDSLNNLIEESIFYNQTFSQNTAQTYFLKEGNASFDMNSGDYVVVRYELSVTSGEVAYIEYINNVFECTNTETGGGAYATASANDYPVIRHEYSKELTPDEFDSILSESRGLIESNTHRGYSFLARIEELEFERATGEAKWKLFSKKSLNES